MKKLIFSVVILISFCYVAFPQSKQESIKELIRLMRQDSILERTFNSTFPTILNEMKVLSKDSLSRVEKQMKTAVGASVAPFAAIFKKMMNEDMVAIYDKYFTEQEIKDFIAFYKSPSGQKMVNTQPDIQKDLTIIIFKKYMPALMDSLKRSYSYNKADTSVTLKQDLPYKENPLQDKKDSIETAKCLSSHDMQKYLSDTKLMVKQGRYKKALERFIWFHEHALEYQPSMRSVRRSFALSDWKSLADIYPPALKALIEIRDRNTKQILENGGTPDLFADVEAINERLDENAKTVKLFESLMKTHPQIAKKVWRYAEDAVFEAKRYDIIRNFIGNPLREFSIIVEEYNRDTARYTNTPVSADLKALNEDRFVEESIRLIEFSLAQDDLKSATEIQQKALAILDDYRLRNAVKHTSKK